MLLYEVFSSQTSVEMIPLDIPSFPWKVVDIDFITNVLSGNLEFSIMVSCDRLTKMVHLYIFPGLHFINEALLLYLKSVFYFHGLPTEVITDLWKEIMGILSIKHSTSITGYHTTVGQIERLNQSIKQFIRCFLRTYLSED